MVEITQMLTPKEVAGILGVHYKTVHIWLREGKLKGIKISYRAWRIPLSALDHFIEQNSNVPPQIITNETKENREELVENQTRDTIHLPPVDIQDSPQSKMKHYLRDIMGEHIADKPKDT
jgi:excisionase family DNA binding protein